MIHFLLNLKNNQVKKTIIISGINAGRATNPSITPKLFTLKNWNATNKETAWLSNVIKKMCNHFI
jgi:hypothetical protein